jgi:hypothetical protein
MAAAKREMRTRGVGGSKEGSMSILVKRKASWIDFVPKDGSIRERRCIFGP